MLTSLKRGALAGLLAGALTAAFGYLLAEPIMDRAVDLEAARAAALGEVGGEETFTRSEQHVGFGLAVLVVGVAFGVLYGVAARYLAARYPGADPWKRAVQLGAGAFFGLHLVPWLRYPANPPGTGDPDTITTRTDLWLASIALGLVGAVAAGLVARGVARASYRHLAVTGVLVGTVALSFVLPGNDDPVDVPSRMLWEFRLLSLASLALLWGTLSAAFGLLSERAAVPDDARALVDA